MNACKLFNTYSSSESPPTYQQEMINEEVKTKAIRAERRHFFAGVSLISRCETFQAAPR